MKVKLLQITENPIDVMWTAARTCYASESPVDMWEDMKQNKEISEQKFYGTLGLDDYIDLKQEQVEKYKEILEKHWKLVQQVLNSGHQSIAEHVYFTFAIEGISRACSHQLVRHRAGIVFSQQSQRYVEIKEDFNFVHHVWENVEPRLGVFNPKPEDVQKAKALVEKYFVNVNDNNYLQFLQILLNYVCAIQLHNEKPEDAREVLPNATKTNITVSCNFRELIHMSHLRLCTRAQKEIRDVFKQIVKEVKAEDGRLASYLVPQCEAMGFCKEHKCCGRKPTLKEIMDGYNKWKEFQKGLDNTLET